MFMRKGHIFVSLILFFFCNELRTQTSTPDFSYHITIDLQNVVSAKDRVKVTITPPPIKARVIYYVLPIYIPGIEGKVDAGRFVRGAKPPFLAVPPHVGRLISDA